MWKQKPPKEYAKEVLSNLESRGYHLQLQDGLLMEQMLAMKAVN